MTTTSPPATSAALGGLFGVKPSPSRNCAVEGQGVDPVLTGLRREGAPGGDLDQEEVGPNIIAARDGWGGDRGGALGAGEQGRDACDSGGEADTARLDGGAVRDAARERFGERVEASWLHGCNLQVADSDDVSGTQCGDAGTVANWRRRRKSPKGGAA